MEEKLEEQRSELEALEAIYMDDFEIVAENPFKFRLNIAAADAEGSIAKAIVLHAELPPEYPDVVPLLRLEQKQGLNSSHVDSIQQLINQEAEENVGMEMIFTLSSAVKDWLEELQQREESQNQENNEEVSSSADPSNDTKETTVRKRQEGILVTPETFAAWYSKFSEERKASIPKNPDEDKPTGRQLFEQGLLDVN